VVEISEIFDAVKNGLKWRLACGIQRQPTDKSFHINSHNRSRFNLYILKTIISEEAST
jgi:hypothetical protein